MNKIHKITITILCMIMLSIMHRTPTRAQNDSSTVYLPLIVGNGPSGNPDAPDIFASSNTWANDLNESQHDLLDRFITATEANRFSVVQTNATLFDSADKLDLNVFDDTVIKISKKNFQIAPVGYKVWMGEGSMPGDSGIFIIDGNGIYGTVRTGNKEYQVDTLGSYQVITELEVNDSIPDEPPGFDEIAVRSAAKNIDDSLQTAEMKLEVSNEDISEISLLVVYTESARDNQIDIEKWIQLRVEEMNAGLKNSGVSAKAVLADSYLTSYSEVIDGNEKMSMDLDRLASEDDEYMQDVHQRRLKVGADIVILVGSNSQYEYCGIAKSILASNKADAFAIVNMDSGCTHKYTFSHEIGHLMGARHNPEADPTSAPFSYGHGYVHTASSPTNWWRTMMAYSLNNNCQCPRILYWSNPNVSFMGFVTGTPKTHDNARVLNESRSRIAALYQKPVPIASISINGETSGVTDTDYRLKAVLSANDATQPIELRWDPEPVSGQGTDTVVYRWSSPGVKTVNLFAENVVNAVQAVHNMNIVVPPPPTAKQVIVTDLSRDAFLAKHAELWVPGWRLYALDTYVHNGQELYSAVWRPSTSGEIGIYGWTRQDFLTKHTELWDQGWRLYILDTFVINGKERYSAVWHPSTSAEVGVYGWSPDDFLAKNDELWNQGWRLYLMDVFVIDGNVRYSAVWRPSTTKEIGVFGWNSEDFLTKGAELWDQGWRLSLMETFVFNGKVHYSAIWCPGTSNEIGIFGWNYTDFLAKNNELSAQGWNVEFIETFSFDDKVLYSVTWRP